MRGGELLAGHWGRRRDLAWRTAETASAAARCRGSTSVTRTRFAALMQDALLVRTYGPYDMGMGGLMPRDGLPFNVCCSYADYFIKV